MAVSSRELAASRGLDASNDRIWENKEVRAIREKSKKGGSTEISPFNQRIIVFCFEYS